MSTRVASGDERTAARRGGVRRTVAVLALVALAFYVGIILLMIGAGT